jgi:polysaccharide biosynthesis transport protein
MQTWELVTYGWYIFRRWWTLVVFAGVLSGATAWILLQQQPPLYVSHTTLMVGTNLRSPNPRENASGIGMTLAAFYADMAKRTPITGQVVEQLKLPFEADLLNEELVSTRVIPQSQLVEIAVLDTSPERAASIANAIADQLITFSPTAPEKIEAQQRFVQSQLTDLESKIKRTDERLQELTLAIQNMTSAGEIAEAQQRLRELEVLKANDQATYNGLLATLDDSSVNTLSVFEAAEIPTKPLPQRSFPATVLATLLGLSLGLGTGWALESIDAQWRRGRSPVLLLNEPHLATVSTAWSGVLSEAALQLPRGQQCLALRSEILLHLAPTARYTIMVTSVSASHERSRISSDLARIFARSGQRVLLVDANLGEGYLASTFGIEGDAVQTLLRDPQQPIHALAQSTEHPYLELLPGNSGGQSAHLVPALHWPQAVRAIEQTAEITIFDGPPVLDSADATLLAPHMGGIVLVIDPASERVGDTRRAIARLREVHAPLLGVVLLDYERRSLRQRMARSALGSQQPNVQTSV